MRSQERRGFTLVELLVVVVLGGFIILSIYEVLITNTRTYAVNNAQIQGQQSLRAGLDVLFGEIREVSAGEGDILAMGRSSITIRTQRAFGLICDTDYTSSPPTITAFKVGPYIRANDSIFVFADNDMDISSDDVWLTKVVQTSDTTATCESSPGQTLSVPNLASTLDTVRSGAPVRAYLRAVSDRRGFLFGAPDFHVRKSGSPGRPSSPEYRCVILVSGLHRCRHYSGYPRGPDRGHPSLPGQGKGLPESAGCRFYRGSGLPKELTDAQRRYARGRIEVLR